MKTMVVSVGCGGLWWHGMSQMANWIAKRGVEDTEVLLVDGDVTEERNKLRQWCVADKPKVALAGIVIEELVGIKAWQWGYRPVDVGELVGYVRDMAGSLGLSPQVMSGEGLQVMVLGLPDNHEARVMGHKAAGEISKWGGVVRVMSVTGGNDKEGGFGYGSVWVKGVCEADWLERHEDIKEEAREEAERRARPEACGMGMTDEQTVAGNGLTAWCVWQAAGLLAGDEAVLAEFRWYTEGGVVQIARKVR